MMLYKYFVGNRRPAVKLTDEEGLPDGMCIDTEGMLWLGCYSSSRVNRYNPITGLYARSALSKYWERTIFYLGIEPFQCTKAPSTRSFPETGKTPQVDCTHCRSQFEFIS